MKKYFLLTPMVFAAVLTHAVFAKSTEPARNASTHAVIINGERISDAVIEHLQRKYRTPVPDGNFWYDRVCGAWGMVGGPTAGFMYAGEKLGGPLQADASHGHTGVFINGRQLHAMDVLALRRIYPFVLQGRWWMDAWGNWGHEGGPIVDNIWAAASRAGAVSSGGSGGGQHRSILSGYDRTGIAVYGY